MPKKKKTTASGEPVMVQSVRRTRSRRMKFCVQRGLGALPSTSKAEGKITAGFFPLRAECINTGIACRFSPELTVPYPCGKVLGADRIFLDKERG